MTELERDKRHMSRVSLVFNASMACGFIDQLYIALDKPDFQNKGQLSQKGIYSH